LTLKEKAIRGAMWSAVENWTTQFLSLLVFMVLARFLDPGAFGLVALASVFVTVLQTLSNQGFAQAIVQRQRLEMQHLDTAFWTNLTISAGFVALLVSVGPLAASAFNQPKLGPVLQWLCVGLLFGSAVGVHRGLFVRRFQFKVLAIRSAAATLAGGAVGITMAIADYGVWALVGQQLVSAGIGAAVLWFASDWRPRLRFSRGHFQDLAGFGSNIVGISILSLVNRRLDDLLIGAVLGPVALGIYAVAYKIFVSMTQLLVESLSKVALPTFSRIRDDPVRLQNAYYNAVQATAIVCLPAFIGTLIIVPDLIPAIFGPQWAQSVPVTQFLMVVGAMYCIGYFNGPVIIAVGKPRLALYLHIANTLGNVVAFLVAVKWGIVAVAAGFALRAIVMLPWGVFLVRRLIRMRVRTLILHLRGPLMGTFTLAVVLQALDFFLPEMKAWQLLLSKLGVGVAIYVLTLPLADRDLFVKMRELLTAAVQQHKRDQMAVEVWQ
jgi:O-antigen/teichoic acid export membrane protein